MDIDVSCDGHVHTYLCMHAKGTMEEYVQSALAGGLRHLVFLEHLEEGIDYLERTWLEEDDFDLYFAEGNRLRQKYGESIKIGLGVEVGYNPSCPDKILERLATRNWDRIGISYHFYRMPENGRHLNFLSRKQKNINTFLKKDVPELLSHYFSTLIEAVQVIPADVLCHLDAGLRHVPGLRLNSEHRDLIDRLLHQLKDTGITLELNTSGYESRDMPFPAFDLITKAAQLDIPMTVGSDAHLPSQVGRHFKRLAEDLDKLSS